MDIFVFVFGGWGLHTNTHIKKKKKTLSHIRELLTRQVSQCKIFNHLDIVNMKLKFQIELLY